MSEKMKGHAHRDVPFLRLIRFVFIVIAAYLPYQWVPYYEPYIQHGDWIYYSLFAAIIGIIILMIESQVQQAFPQELFIGVLGLVAGLSTSTLILVAVPESIPSVARDVIPVVLHLFLGYFGVVIALRYAHRFDFSASAFLAHSEDRLYGCKILDTSVLIDGRIVDILEAGFIGGLVIIPSFVLNELQALADSKDPIKRSKGRRGLDISKRLQRIERCEVELLAEDFPNLVEVDKKLLTLSKKYEATLVTLDFNLNKVSDIENVPVLNINQLAQSLKTVVLPGEEISIQIIREGKEPNQGIGYLDDGTMVVVENGRSAIGQPVTVIVASVLQTSAGRMIFTRIKEENGKQKEEKKVDTASTLIDCKEPS